MKKILKALFEIIVCILIMGFIIWMLALLVWSSADRDVKWSDKTQVCISEKPMYSFEYKYYCLKKI